MKGWCIKVYRWFKAHREVKHLSGLLTTRKEITNKMRLNLDEQKDFIDDLTTHQKLLTDRIKELTKHNELQREEHGIALEHIEEQAHEIIDLRRELSKKPPTA